MPDVAEVVVKVMQRAAEDGAYKEKLLSDTHAAIEEVAGRPIPEGINVVVHENTTTTMHFTLPYQPPADGELSDDELEQVAGGGKGSLFQGETCDLGNMAPATVDPAFALAAGASMAIGYSLLWDLGVGGG